MKRGAVVGTALLGAWRTGVRVVTSLAERRRRVVADVAPARSCSLASRWRLSPAIRVLATGPCFRARRDPGPRSGRDRARLGTQARLEALAVRWQVTARMASLATKSSRSSLGSRRHLRRRWRSRTTWRRPCAGCCSPRSRSVIGPLALELVVRVKGQSRANSSGGSISYRHFAALALLNVGIVAFVLRASNALHFTAPDLLGDLQPFGSSLRIAVSRADAWIRRVRRSSSSRGSPTCWSPTASPGARPTLVLASGSLSAQATLPNSSRASELHGGSTSLSA